MRRYRLSLPASYFGVPIGVLALANAWRAATRVWGAPAFVAEALVLVGVLLWAALLVAYAGKYAWARAAFVAELLHPVQGAFVTLAGVATLLVALAVLPYSAGASWALFAGGTAWVVGVAVFLTGCWWTVERDAAAVTPALYLPTVAGGFVIATVSAALGAAEAARLALGIALITWCAIESVLLQRLYLGPPIPPAARPLLAMHLAPPAIGTVSSAAVVGLTVPVLTFGLLGYALFVAVVLLRLQGWARHASFSMAWWAAAFGAAALGTAPLRLLELAESPLLAALAPLTFLVANVVVGGLTLATARLLTTPDGRAAMAPVPSPPDTRTP